MSEKPEFVLFMMTTDKFCNNFITKLNTKPELLKKINIVDIDRIPAIPEEVDEVPCIYDGKKLHKGKEAFSWLNEKMMDFLSAANDGLSYSFIDGQEEQIFGTYSLLGQQNGSFGMSPESGGSANDSGGSKQTYDNYLSIRNQEIDIPSQGGQKQNLNKN